MEELNTTVVPEGTAPQGLQENNTTEASAENVEQSATSADNDNVQAENESADNENLEQESSVDGNADLAPFLSLPHNHEIRELSREETVDFVQTGMHAKPILADLRYLAAQDGHKSVKEFIDALKSSAEASRLENIRSQLVDDGNEDLAQAILAAELSKIKDAAGVIEADEQKAFAAEYENEHTRLADEFIALQKEFPELKEFKDVPKTVLQMAQKEKISLLDAQLRFKHAENKKIKQAEMSAAAAAQSSTGSMADSNTTHSTSFIDAMKKGIWQ
jgi:hypothetical protein